MTQWATFVAITGVVLVLLLVLSHLTQSSFAESESESESERDSDATADADPGETDADRPKPDSTAPEQSELDHSLLPETETDEPIHVSEDASADRRTTADSERPSEGGTSPGRGGEIDPADLSAGMLLANVAISQGLFALVLLGAVLYTGIPADALGVEWSIGYLETGLVLGTVAGIGLYIANEIGAATATQFGFDHDEQLRELLAPDSLRGWLVLLVVVLPIIAVFEELLFRAALIGVVSAGYGIDPWLLAVGSSIAFAIGHGMQGSVGVVVTGALGFVLAAIFIVTGSFLVVVVAHYLINALEFVVHEGFEFEWADVLESDAPSEDGPDTGAGTDVDPGDGTHESHD